MKHKIGNYIWLLSIIVLLTFSIVSCDLSEKLYNLTIQSTSNGTTYPAGTVDVISNIPFNISAIPDSSYCFAGWEIVKGKGVTFGDQNEQYTTITLSAGDATIMVNFISNECSLILTTRGDGTTDPEPDVSFFVNYNESIRIIAKPGENWRFEYWEIIGGICNITNSYEADTTVRIISEEAIIRANFSDTQAPEGYSVTFNQSYIDETNVTSLEFTYSGAETGGTYHYSIDDQGNGSTLPITGSGIVEQEEATISGINVASLDDSILNLTFFITDISGNDGNNEYDTILKDTIAPSFFSVNHLGADGIYRPGETITFSVNMGEPGLTVSADLSVLDSRFTIPKVFNDTNDNYYSFTTDALGANTIIEGTGISIEFEATDSVHTVSHSFLSLILDNTPPAGSFVINNDHNFTISTDVTLTIHITGATSMRFGNSISGLNSADWETYKTSSSLNLSPGIELKTVYGEFRDVAGNVYQTTDTIYVVQKLTPYDGEADDRFGNSVATSSDGSTIVVGAYNGGFSEEEGSIYVYSGSDWGIEQEVYVAGCETDDRFGFSVAVSADGSTIAVAAPSDDDKGVDAGAVYVCYGNYWANSVKLTASDGEASDSFGQSVAISADGSTVVVGASGDDDKGSSAGAVYVYNGTNWGTQTKLTASDGAAGDQYGRSISVSSNGSRIVVGSSYDDDNGLSSGSVYVYSGSSWGTQTKLTANNGAATDYFGCSVAISPDGSTVVAGAYYDDDNGSSSGSVYVCNGTNWGTQTKLTASDGAAADYFGRSVAVSSNGSVVVVGADSNDDFGTNSGSVYVYSGLSWTTETLITVDDGQGADSLGFSVAVSSDGSIITAGAYGDSDNGVNSGSAYVVSLE